LEIILQRLVSQLTGKVVAKIATDKSGDLYAVGFLLGIFASIVPDVHVGADQDLPKIRRIGKGFLVSGHTRVKTYLTSSGAFGTNRMTGKHGSVSQYEVSFIRRGLSYHSICLKILIL